MITKFNKFDKFDKVFENLPRQASIDQLKRVRAEMKADHSEVKIGPTSKKSEGGDIGDKVFSDMKKHNFGNLLCWDNVIDRKIDSYEDFVAHDNKKSLGYTM